MVNAGHTLHHLSNSLSQPMEIALVGMSSRMSGVEFSTLYLAEQLDKQKWLPVVISSEEGDLVERCRAAGLPTAIVSANRGISTSIRLGGVLLPNPIALVINGFAILLNALKLRRYLDATKPRIVITKGMSAHFFGGLAARSLRIPCVWHVQDRVSERYGPFFKWIISGGGRLLADRCIADAESIARQLGTLIPKDRISIILNGIDTDRFSPDVDGLSVRSEWGVDRDTILIGVVARLTPWKGQHLLLEISAGLLVRHPNLKVVLVGTPMFDNDKYLKRLREYVRTHGLGSSVIFAGFRWDLPQVLAALDVVAHTSVEKDSSPLAVVSAMAAGKPIVCSRVDGTAELFDDGRDALLFTPGDSHMLQESLQRILSDPDLAVRLGRSAREKAVKELNLELFAERCEHVLTDVLDKVNARRQV